MILRTVFNIATTGTQYAPSNTTEKLGIPVPVLGHVTFTIDHPASSTIAYSVQVSNMTDEECLKGSDDWTDYGEIATLTKSSAAKDFIEFVDVGFARCRLKLVTTVGTATPTVRSCTKLTGRG